jgi:predicted P-loop ATPase
MTGMSARKVVTLVDGGKGSKGGPPAGGGGGMPGGDDWHYRLTKNRDGKVEGTLHNLLLIFENDEHLAGLWWLNESSNQVVLSRDAPWPGGNREEFTDSDSCELAAWLQTPENYGMSCSDEAVLKAVIAVARRHRRHPIREYLCALKWDGVERIDSMLVDLFGAEDTSYCRRAARCFVVSAVARIMWFDAKQPFVGAQVDFMLVLEGEQGKKKSSAIRELFGSNWFVETNESPSSKDFYQVIQGCWGVEIAEMDSFGKADVTNVKTAITRRVDKFRAPYERVPRSYRRECVFVGTTNEGEYLRDPTGGRRFLPVRTAAMVDIEAIHKLRDQLWAEAVKLFNDGEQWWELPPEAGEQQEQRYVGDSWEGIINRWLAGAAVGEHSYPGRLIGGRPDWTTTAEVLQYALKVEIAKHGKPEQMRVAAAMKRLGWHHDRVMVDGYRERRWLRAAHDVQAAAGGGGSDPPF